MGDEYTAVVDFVNLMEAGKLCMRNNRWKSSVQMFEIELLYRTCKLKQNLENGMYRPMPTCNFTKIERGKKRQIKAHHINDRMLYKSFCLHSLGPETEGLVINNNSASQKGKGTDHAISAFRQCLRKAYARWGSDFYVVTVDYSGYFDSIPHNQIPQVIKLSDPRCTEILANYVDVFSGDYGIGIGGEPSQLVAIAYPYQVDWDIMCNCPVLGSQRYMDDSCAVCHTKDEAQYTLNTYIERSEKLGLRINYKRTRIHHMTTDSVTWLKKRTHLDKNTGKIVMQLTRENIRDRKRVIRFQHEKMEQGVIPRYAIFQSIQCWTNYAMKYNSYEQTKLVVKLFSELFDVPYNVSRHLLHKKNKGWLQMCEDYHLL